MMKASGMAGPLGSDGTTAPGTQGVEHRVGPAARLTPPAESHLVRHVRDTVFDE